MSLIKIENLSFTYPGSGDKIFDNVSFQIDSDWKLGFVGRNGKGKTTFLNLLMDKYEYNGNIKASVEFEYFPYQINDEKQLVKDLMEQICGEVEQWEMLRELSLLDVNERVFEQEFNTLSNGERSKVLLAAMFLKTNAFLLIDEPTNHLDYHARACVARYLKRKKGYILVSHDRDFIDKCVDHILSLNRSNIEVQTGNYSSWFENFNRQQDFELAKNTKLKKDIKKLQISATQSKQWSDKVEATKIGNGPCDRGYIGHKAAKMMKRSKNLERRTNQAIEDKKALLKNFEEVEDLTINCLKHHARKLVILKDLVVKYNNVAINKPISFEIENEDIVVLSGKNGCGKSSIIKLIIGNDIDYTGEMIVANGLKISYVPQDTAYLKGDLKSFIDQEQINENRFKAILRKLDFGREQFDKRIEDFSYGQKKKVALAKSLCEQAHLYIWDEPLNYIDIYSRMQIEKLLLEYRPTMLMVEHDKKFRDTVANKVIEFPGTIDPIAK